MEGFVKNKYSESNKLGIREVILNTVVLDFSGGRFLELEKIGR